MRKWKGYLLFFILCIIGYTVIRNHFNRDYSCISSITYSAGSESDWAYGNQRKEFDVDSACYVRIGECIFTEKKYNVGNEVKVTYRFIITGDCGIELADGTAEKRETGDDRVIEYTRKLKAQDPSEMAEDVVIFRYTPKEEGSIMLEVKYSFRIKDEFDSQSTIYFVN